MKKLIAFLLALSMVLALVACGSGDDPEDSAQESDGQVSEASESPDDEADDGEEPADNGGEESYRVAYLTMSSEGDYWQAVETEYAAACATYGIEMDVINADYDPVRQVEQIENAILQDYDMLFVLATDPDAVADSCRKAMDADIPVFAFIKDTGEDARTCFRGADEEIIGIGVAEYAADWATETFGGGEGSCNVIIVGGNSAGSETERYDAVCEVIEADPQFNVLETLRVETSQAAAQAATENLVAQYEDINCIIFCSAEMALGACAYLESDASPIKDYTDFGVFGGGLSEELAEDMRKAAEGTGIVRGLINTGGSNYQSGLEVAEQIVKVLSGEPFDAFTPVPAVRVNVDNLAEFGY